MVKLVLVYLGVLCKSCKHRATYTTPAPTQFLIYGCRERKLKFGTETDWKAGKWAGSKDDKEKFKITDQPVKCDKFEDIYERNI